MTLLENPPEAEILLEFRKACLAKIATRPNDHRLHDAVLDLYLEAKRRLEKGAHPGYVLVDFSTKLRGC